MWTQIELEKTSTEFQNLIDNYISKRDGYKLLKVNQITDDKENVYKYSAYLFYGNTCVLVSMYISGVLDGNVYEEIMSIGEMKEFFNHPELEWWFK